MFNDIISYFRITTSKALNPILAGLLSLCLASLSFGASAVFETQALANPSTMQADADFPGENSRVSVDRQLHPVSPDSRKESPLEKERMMLLNEFATLPPESVILEVLAESNLGRVSLVTKKPERPDGHIDPIGFPESQIQEFQEKAKEFHLMMTTPIEAPSGHKVVTIFFPLNVFQRVFPNIRDTSWVPIVHERDTVSGLSQYDQKIEAVRNLGITDEEVEWLDNFVIHEARKLDPKYWPLLPFNPRQKTSAEPPSVIGKPFLQSFTKSYRVACLIHGAPEAKNYINNRIARRQLRDNGAPYIIHLLGMVWAAVHIAGIRDPRVLETIMMHDVPEDGVANIQKLNPEISDQQAMGQIRHEITHSYRGESQKIFALLSWFIRGPRSYRQYITNYEKTPLDIVLSKLLDQANSLYDIPFLVINGNEGRARRQVAKMLRFFSRIISLTQFEDEPRYRRTVLHLMKTLMFNSASVGWFEPYYEREHGSRRRTESISDANDEILTSLDQFQAWLSKLWVQEGLGQHDGFWSPALHRSKTELFKKRLENLSDNIIRGVSLPAAYVEPVSAKNRGLKLEIRDAAQSDVLTLIKLYRAAFPTWTNTRHMRSFSNFIPKILARDMNGFCLVAQMSGRLVGMLIGRTFSDTGTILLTHVAVPESERGKGIGSSLFETVIEIYSHAAGVRILTAHAPPGSVVERHILLPMGFQLKQESATRKQKWIYDYRKCAAA